LSHVYASLGDLKNMITDSGATSLGTTNDTLLLGVLASVSETIDDRMERSGFGSGFGPRTGTNPDAVPAFTVRAAWISA